MPIVLRQPAGTDAHSCSVGWVHAVKAHRAQLAADEEGIPVPIADIEAMPVSVSVLVSDSALVFATISDPGPVPEPVSVPDPIK